MTNIMRADIFRMRKGAAARNTIIAAFATILFLGVMLLLVKNGVMQDAVEVLDPLMTQGEKQDFTVGVYMLDTQSVQATSGGMGFTMEVLGQGFINMFFLPFMLVIFCTDFNTGTYRNTLSYETNRTKVYLAKLLLSVVTGILFVAACLVFSWLLGSIMFGFGGFSLALLGRMFTVLLLNLPMFLGLIALTHCIIAFSKKSSTTIAVFVVGLLAFAMAAQLLAQFFPALSWLLLLDLISVGKLLAVYETLSVLELGVALGWGVLLTVGATALGIAHYKKADLA